MILPRASTHLNPALTLYQWHGFSVLRPISYFCCIILLAIICDEGYLPQRHCSTNEPEVWMSHKFVMMNALCFESCIPSWF